MLMSVHQQQQTIAIPMQIVAIPLVHLYADAELDTLVLELSV